MPSTKTVYRFSSYVSYNDGRCAEVVVYGVGKRGPLGSFSHSPAKPRQRYVRALMSRSAANPMTASSSAILPKRVRTVVLQLDSNGSPHKGRAHDSASADPSAIGRFC